MPWETTPGPSRIATRPFQFKPRFVQAFYHRGAARFAQGDYAGAIVDCDQALALDPRYAPAYNNRAAARYNQGDIAGAG